jgi:hypothetical protein
MTTEAETLEKSFADLEQRVREGLGPEGALVDVLKNGQAVEAMVRSDAGRALIRDCLARAAEVLQRMTGNVATLTPERAFQDVLALSLEVGILRRVAATIRAGHQAEARIIEAGREIEAHSSSDDVTE